MENIEELKKQLAVSKKEKDKVWEKFMSMSERNIPYTEASDWYERQPVVRRCEELEQKIRQYDTYKLTPIPDYGDHMTMEEFAKWCKTGPVFTDYDGFGYYATDKEESDIKVYPSDITSGNYRKDFTHVVWYNK